MPTFGKGYFSLRINRFEETVSRSLKEFLPVMRRTPVFERLWTQQTWKGKGDKHMTVGIVFHETHIDIAIEAKDIDLVNAAHANLRSEFSLRNPEIPIPDSSRAIHPQPTIFLGRHFDRKASQAAQILMRFLKLLGFHVIEGEDYNSRNIPEKVKALMDRQDIYLGLVTGAKEHDWLTAEISYALGKGKHIMLLVENGAKFNPTILGRDFEQARFPASTIEKSFIKLLTEFRSVGVRKI